MATQGISPLASHPDLGLTAQRSMSLAARLNLPRNFPSVGGLGRQPQPLLHYVECVRTVPLYPLRFDICLERAIHVIPACNGEVVAVPDPSSRCGIRTPGSGGFCQAQIHAAVCHPVVLASLAHPQGIGEKEKEKIKEEKEDLESARGERKKSPAPPPPPPPPPHLQLVEEESGVSVDQSAEREKSLAPPSNQQDLSQSSASVDQEEVEQEASSLDTSSRETVTQPTEGDAATAAAVTADPGKDSTSGGNAAAAKADVPQFYFPSQGGLRRLPSAKHIQATIDRITHSLEAAPFSLNLGAGVGGSGGADAAVVPAALIPNLMEVLQVPLYWKQPIISAADPQLVPSLQSTTSSSSSSSNHNQNNAPTVSIHTKGLSVKLLLTTWRRLLSSCSSEADQFIWLLTRGQKKYLERMDFTSFVQDVLETHPGLAFLESAKEFHTRYVITVIARIFFGVNTSWSGRINAAELRRSNLLPVIQSLQSEEDINMVTQYFSYEHFYVIYCKFWELDDDHDLVISKSELARHANYAISSRMVDRIFSGAVFHVKTNPSNNRAELMEYADFVWFLLAEEDKRNPRSIEYWFRCMDIDGDGQISMYEMEFFYSEQLAKMEEMGIDPIPFEDCLCSMLDMVRPAQPHCIRLADLKRCKLCHIFFDTFINLPKYFDHEQRDPFSNLKDIEQGLNEISDWDRYASEAYEALVAEDGASQNVADNQYDSEVDADHSNNNNSSARNSSTILDAMGLELGSLGSSNSRTAAAIAALSNDPPARSSLESL